MEWCKIHSLEEFGYTQKKYFSGFNFGKRWTRRSFEQKCKTLNSETWFHPVKERKLFKKKKKTGSENQ